VNSWKCVIPSCAVFEARRADVASSSLPQPRPSLLPPLDSPRLARPVWLSYAPRPYTLSTATVSPLHRPSAPSRPLSLPFPPPRPAPSCRNIASSLQNVAGQAASTVQGATSNINLNDASKNLSKGFANFSQTVKCALHSSHSSTVSGGRLTSFTEHAGSAPAASRTTTSPSSRRVRLPLAPSPSRSLPLLARADVSRRPSQSTSTSSAASTASAPRTPSSSP